MDDDTEAALKRFYALLNAAANDIKLLQNQISVVDRALLSKLSPSSINNAASLLNSLALELHIAEQCMKLLAYDKPHN